MLRYYNLYDLLATIVPGGLAALIALAALFVRFPGSPIIQALLKQSASFLAVEAFGIAFLAGHVLHPLGNGLEWLLRRVLYSGKTPGQSLLLGGDDLSQPFRDTLRRAIQMRFRIDPTHQDAYHLCYTYVQHYAWNSVPMRMRALRGFYQQLAVSGVVGLAIAVVLARTAPAEQVGILWATAGAAGVLALASILRYVRFLRIFALCVLRTFFVLAGGANAIARMGGNVSPADWVLILQLEGMLAVQGEPDGLGDPASGALDFVRHLGESGWKLAIETAKPREIAVEWIETQRVAGLFRDEDGTYRIYDSPVQRAVSLCANVIRFRGSFDAALEDISSFSPDTVEGS